jgi:hypothetical protein
MYHSSSELSRAEVHVHTKLVGSLVLISLCALPGGAAPKPSVPCKAYVIVIEQDELTVGLTMVGLNKPQLSWYKKHGDKGKYAGICPLNPAGDTQEAIEALPSQPPNRMNPALPVYAIVWGEHLVSQPYTYTYTTHEQANGTVSGTATDNNGNTTEVQGSTTTTVPVEHQTSGVKHYFVADGFLAVWNPSSNKGKGSFVPARPLHNHNRTIFTSASTSLLKDGLEQISSFEHLDL